MIKQLRKYFLRSFNAVDKEEYYKSRQELVLIRAEAMLVECGEEKYFEIFGFKYSKYKPHHSLKQHRIKGRFA